MFWSWLKLQCTCMCDEGAIGSVAHTSNHTATAMKKITFFLVSITVPVNQVRDDTHITSIKIVLLQEPSRLSIKSKIFPPPWTWTSNFKRTPLSLTNYGTTSAPYKIKTKAKPSHVTLKLTTRSIVRFSPQAMNGIIKGWLLCLTPESI